MNLGVIREKDPLDSRVALTPPVVRHLVGRGNTVWVEAGAGSRAMYRDDEYIRAGAQLAYSPSEVIHRAELLVRITAPDVEILELANPGAAIMAFHHLAVASRGVLERLIEKRLTAIGCEIVESPDGRLPILAVVSEIAGQMTIPLAAHLLRSSSGGRGILLGGSLGVPPARVVILGAGVVGSWAARGACAAGASVTVFDIDAFRLRRLMERLPSLATAFAEPEAIAAAVASADVLIGAVLVAGAKTPHLVTRRMVESMRPGSVIIDVSIDQGGCVETSRPTTIAQPTYLDHGVVHYAVPNLTAEIGRSLSTALAQTLLPYLLEISTLGLDRAIESRPELARGIYVHGGCVAHPCLADVWKVN